MGKLPPPKKRNFISKAIPYLSLYTILQQIDLNYPFCLFLFFFNLVICRKKNLLLNFYSAVRRLPGYYALQTFSSVLLKAIDYKYFIRGMDFFTYHHEFLLINSSISICVEHVKSYVKARFRF